MAREKIFLRSGSAREEVGRWPGPPCREDGVLCSGAGAGAGAGGGEASCWLDEDSSTIKGSPANARGAESLLMRLPNVL